MGIGPILTVIHLFNFILSVMKTPAPEDTGFYGDGPDDYDPLA